LSASARGSDRAKRSRRQALAAGEDLAALRERPDPCRHVHALAGVVVVVLVEGAARVDADADVGRERLALVERPLDGGGRRLEGRARPDAPQPRPELPAASAISTWAGSRLERLSGSSSSLASASPRMRAAPAPLTRSSGT
jgi:hypothetical protein